MTQAASEHSTADSDTDPRISVILPALDEATALPSVITDLRRHVPDVEIIVVDDGSSDGTADVARDLRCRTIVHDHNRGKGTALRTGVAETSGSIIIVMDADATYPASAIPAMIDLLAENDFVRAERRIDTSNTPRINRIGNRAIEFVLRSLHGLGRGDHLSGLYGFRREAIEVLDTKASGFDIEVEIGIKAREQGLQIASVPIDYRPRIGEKKLNPLSDGLRILVRILRLVVLYRPLLVFGLPGLVLTVLSLVAAIALSGGPIVTDYLGLSIHTFIVAALGILAGFQLMVFGLAGSEYRRQLGFSTPDLLSSLTSGRSRAMAAATGTLLTVVCGTWLVLTIVGWLVQGGPEFTATTSLVMTATGSVFGLQILSASLFLTLLSDHDA